MGGKTDSLGNLEWEQSYGGSMNDYATMQSSHMTAVIFLLEEHIRQMVM